MNQALRSWVGRAVAERPDVRRVGYFGSYARGDWGVGSDLDVVIVIDATDAPFARRSAAWDLTALPVPADLLVYTEAEWGRLSREGCFPRMRREVVWVHPP